MNIFLIVLLIIIILLTYCNCINNKKNLNVVNITSIEKDSVCNNNNKDNKDNDLSKINFDKNEPDFYTLDGPVWPVNKNNILLNEKTRPGSTNKDETRFEILNQIGTLTNATNDIYPLLGKKNYKVNSRWNYYTKNRYNTYIPLKVNNKDCNSDLGCDELFTGDYINITELRDRFRVEIF